MVKRNGAKTTFSVRLSQQALSALQERASEDRKTVGAVIRSLVADYLDGRDVEDVLAQTEARIVATLERMERKRARQRRQIELILLEVDYLRRNMDFRFMKRLVPDEDTASVFRRSDKTYFDWVQKVHKHRLDQLTNAITEPTVMLDEDREATESQPPAEPESATPALQSLEPRGPLGRPAVAPAATPNDAGRAAEKPPPTEPASAVPAPKSIGTATPDVAAPSWR